MRAALLALVVLGLVLAPKPGVASSVTVPADYPTIPLAIASGADTVFVGDGVYPESLLIDRSLVLLAAPPSTHQGSTAFPTVGSITIQPSNGTVVVRDLRVAGHVRQNSTSHGQVTTFEACRIDSGVTAGGSSNLIAFHLRGCLIIGGVDLFLYYPDCSGNTVTGGINVRSHGTVYVRGNYVLGPAATGIHICCEDAWPIVAEGNNVTGVVTGIYAEEAGTCTSNTIEDCTGDGIFAAQTRFGRNFQLTGNVIRRCGLNGIRLGAGSAATIDGNRIEDVSGSGIVGATPGTGTMAFVTGNVVLRPGQRGIDVADLGLVIANRVLQSGAEGIAVAGLSCRSNVIGRSAGSGLVSSVGGGTVSQNTSYLNAGSGFQLVGTAGDSVSRNIGYGNSGYGLTWSGDGPPQMSCNDWFGNITGAALGVVPGGTDLAVNPAFCDLPLDDVFLAGSSPLVNAPGCGQIGALGSGCGSAVAVPGQSIGSGLRLDVAPSPARGVIRFSWRSPGGPTRLEVFDVAGQILWSASPQGGDGVLVWQGTGANGLRLAPGVYFARLSVGARTSAGRVVLLR